jgi:hypothetical protein
MACPFPDGSGSAAPAQQPATDPTQRYKPDVRWSRPLMAWIYLGRRKQIHAIPKKERHDPEKGRVLKMRHHPEKIRTFKDAPRSREEPSSRSKVATQRLRDLSPRLSGPIGLSDGRRMGPGCPYRVQGAPDPFSRRTKEKLFPLLAEYVAQRAHKSRNAAPLECPPSVTFRTCRTGEPAEHRHTRREGP